jgi:hypothetical protein
MDPSQDTVKMVGFANSQEHIFVAKWSQCSVGTSTNNVDACTNYIWNNDTIFNSGTYTKNLTNNNGCDSISVINLNILSPVLASQNIQLCAGDSIQVGNNFYAQTGVYQNVLTAINGCDSTVTTTLFIDTLQAQISNAGQTLSAVNFPSNATFQWLNCDNNFSPLIGETTQFFTPVTNGNYAVIVDNSNCTDTSACNPFFTVGLHAVISNHFRIYPIPADETLFIESGLSNAPIRIFDAQGKVIFETIKSAKRLEIDVSLFQSGLYFIQSENIAQPFTILNNK